MYIEGLMDFILSLQKMWDQKSKSRSKPAASDSSRERGRVTFPSLPAPLTNYYPLHNPFFQFVCHFLFIWSIFSAPLDHM